MASTYLYLLRGSFHYLFVISPPARTRPLGKMFYICLMCIYGYMCIVLTLHFQQNLFGCWDVISFFFIYIFLSSPDIIHPFALFFFLNFVLLIKLSLGSALFTFLGYNNSILFVQHLFNNLYELKILISLLYFFWSINDNQTTIFFFHLIYSLAG